MGMGIDVLAPPPTILYPNRMFNLVQVVRLKQLRRRLKNRTYAKLSRHKRVATISMFEEEISELEQEVGQLNNQFTF